MTRRALVATALLAAFCVAPAFADGINAPPALPTPASHRGVNALPSLRIVNNSGCTITLDLLQNGHISQGNPTIAPWRDWEWNVAGEFKIVVTGKCGNPTAPGPAEVTATLRNGAARTYSVDVDSKNGNGGTFVIHFLY